ncbi:MAG: PKD domain-containing protein, partial [candidate division Zixibacteria bacterium]
GGYIAEHVWLIDDSFTTYRRDPTVTFDTPGLIPIRLIAVGDCPNLADTTYDTVLVGNCAFLELAPVSGTVCQTVETQFGWTDTAGGIFDSLVWVWDDGTSNSDNNNPAVHVYAEPGPMNVKVIVHTPFGQTEASLNTAFDVWPTATADSIYIDTTEQDTSYTFSFAGWSDAASKWIWFYGDGTTDTLFVLTAMHKYDTAGIYTCTLIVDNDCAVEDTLIVPDLVEVTATP